MLDSLTTRFNKGRELFTALSPTRKVLALSVLAAVLTAFVVLLVWTNKTEYGVMYSGLSTEDAGPILAKLNERKIPYRLTADGTAIEVPKAMVHETRLYLATQGLPTGGSVGLEMFNQARLGETDFIQKLNFQRALQGEIERTIKKFSAVEQVRVHLNIPKESLFIEEKRPPSASVVLQLKRGQNLSGNQLAGIVHLVASSVEGLSADNISIVDTQGGLLYSKKHEADGRLLTEQQLQQRKNIEQAITGRITSMIERIVGPEKAIARVSAELTAQQITANEEIYDPDKTAVRSEQRLIEKNQGPARGATGIPQSTFQLGTGNQKTGQTASQGENYERSEETTNYEITRTTRQIITPAGDIKRLSVAVLLDGIYNEVVKDGKKEKAFTPRPQEELDKITQLVKNAIGFDQQRGDQVVVQSVPFFSPEEGRKVWYLELFDRLANYGKPLFNIILIVLFFLFVVRPLIAWLQRATAPPPPPEPMVEPAALTHAVEHEALPDYKREPGQLNREQVLTLARQDPERTINILRSWIEEK